MVPQHPQHERTDPEPVEGLFVPRLVAREVADGREGLWHDGGVCPVQGQHADDEGAGSEGGELALHRGVGQVPDHDTALGA